ncbi:MAG: BMP family ABC transporter substrate-binding protein [Actinobacteria bacterium]|nr:BMP family ABC transporter substrate-binding protein [Actinomycetota bacterium]
MRQITQMRMRRVALLAIAAGVFSLLAVPSKAAEPVKIGIAYDTGGLGDYSFNDAVAVGLNSAKKQYAFQVIPTVTIGSEADRELRLNSLIAKGAKYILAVGTAYATSLEKVAYAHPELQFGIVNNASIRLLNVASLVFNERQGGYLAGAAAALASNANKIAIIANTSQGKDYELGFASGARSIKKNITVISRYGVGKYGEITQELVSMGVDVIFISITGSAADVFAAVVDAKKRGNSVKLIGIEPDQYVSLTPAARKYIVASVVKRVDKAVVDFISSAQIDFPLTDILDATVGIYGRRFGIAEEGVEISLWSKALSKFSKEINAAILRAQTPSIIGN